MTTGGTPRRTLLQRGLALLAGGIAVATGSRVIRADGGITPAPGTTLTLYTRPRPIAPPPGAARAVQADHARQLASGELLDGPHGKCIGSVYTNCFCPGAPFGAQRSTSDLEFQVMQLADGTLFGMCGGTAEAGEKVRAIVGGTGRYAGARGAYIERPAAGAGDDVVELVLTLAG
jgi:hypothetical protein